MREAEIGWFQHRVAELRQHAGDVLPAVLLPVREVVPPSQHLVAHVPLDGEVVEEEPPTLPRRDPLRLKPESWRLSDRCLWGLTVPPSEGTEPRRAFGDRFAWVTRPAPRAAFVGSTPLRAQSSWTAAISSRSARAPATSAPNACTRARNPESEV